MTRNRLLIVLLCALLFAACAPAPPVEYDWCYQFDFTTENSWSQAFGTWEAGVGYKTDANFNLNISYSREGVVSPRRVEVAIARIDDGDINISANAVVWDMYADFDNQTMPSFVSFYEHSVNAVDYPAGNTANISLSASAHVAMQRLRTYGILENPFGDSNCGSLEPTSTAPPTNTRTPFPTVAPATGTNTPPPTNTASRTPTPSMTPTEIPCLWEEDIDFTAAASPFAIDTDIGPGAASYGSGVGWKEVHVGCGDGNCDVLYIRSEASYSSTVTSIEAWLGGNFGNSYDFTMAVGVNGGTFDAGQVAAGYVHTEGVTLAITSGQYFRLGHANFISTGGHTSPDAYISRVRYRGTGNNPFTGDICSVPTLTPTVTGTQTYTATPIPPTATRTLNPTWTTDPLITPTLTRTPTRTLVPIVPPATGLYTPTNGPGTTTPDLVMTWIAGTSAATAAGTGGPIGGTATPGVTSTPSTPGSGGIGTPIPGVDGDIGGVGQVGEAVIGTGGNVLELVQSWLGGISLPFTRIVDAYYNTAAEAPPGLPRCRTAPLEHDVCAIWYIMEFTIFSGPVGGLIIAVGTAIVDLATLIVFIQQARAIIARIMEITKIG